MNAKEHPDFGHEFEKLAMVKGSISDEYDKLIAKSQDYGRLAKEVINDPDVMNQLQVMDSKRMDILSRLKEKPYFGRVDFCELGKGKESYYIGRASIDDPQTKNLIVLDWRAPLAGLYYSGEIGEVMYASPEGLMIGDLDLKRQYDIERGELINIFDKGLTPMDEFLQKALWEKKDNRLGDIVTTIQDEQNRIIRAPKEGALIIQGVAGSGKTTIVLHRIAYLMYTYQEIFRADKILMIVPNKLFLNYISDVLPDLGVHDIEQVTFEMLFEKIFNREFAFYDKSDKLKALISLNMDDEKRKNFEFISAFKGSMRLKQILDSYAESLVGDAMPNCDLTIDGHVVYTNEEIDNLYNNQYAYMPIVKRKEKIRSYVKDTVKERVEKLTLKIARKYDMKIQKLKNSGSPDDMVIKSKICELIDGKNLTTETLINNMSNDVKDYFSKWESFDIKDLITKLFSDEETLEEHSASILSDEEIKIITQYTKNQLKKHLEKEDMPAMIYLKLIIEGSDFLKRYAHIVVDEAQDYNQLQMHVLRMISSNGSFTIVGDVAQGINSYRGISGWGDLTESVFDKNSTKYQTISICYRSTKEIIDLGNSVISELGDNNIVLGKPALRYGSKPMMDGCSSDEDMFDKINLKIDELKEFGYKSISIMCKSDEACMRAYDSIRERRSDDIQLLSDNETEYRNGITVMTPQLSKGLEFDAVIIVDDKHDKYDADPLHIKLLYVAITRALHELYIYHTDEPSELLTRIDQELYEMVS